MGTGYREVSGLAIGRYVDWLYVLPDDDKRYAIETCRSSESVLK
jgi:hypothetical protein